MSTPHEPQHEPGGDRQQPARRLTHSQIIEQLLQRGGGEHSSVSLTRNAKGETQIEVTVRTDEHEVQTARQAADVATSIYNELRDAYPFASAPIGGGGNG